MVTWLVTFRPCGVDLCQVHHRLGVWFWCKEAFEESFVQKWVSQENVSFVNGCVDDYMMNDQCFSKGPKLGINHIAMCHAQHFVDFAKSRNLHCGGFAQRHKKQVSTLGRSIAQPIHNGHMTSDLSTLWCGSLVLCWFCKIEDFALWWFCTKAQETGFNIGSVNSPAHTQWSHD